MVDLLLCLPLRLGLLLSLLRFLVGRYPLFDPRPPPPPVFERYDAVDQKHKQCYYQECRKSPLGIGVVFVCQLQAYPTLDDGKSHQEPAVPSVDVPYEQDLFMADTQTLVNNSNERLDGC